jgi:predicted PurR-regulated permease PerM
MSVGKDLNNNLPSPGSNWQDWRAPEVAYSVPHETRTLEAAVVSTVVIAALYLGQSLLIPLALAIFLTFLLSPIVSRLRKLRVPKILAVTLVVLAAFTIVVLSGIVIARQVTSFAEELPRYQLVLMEKIKVLKSFAAPGWEMERAAATVNVLRKEIEQGNAPADTAAPSSRPNAQVQQPPQQPLTVRVEQPSTPFEQLERTLTAVAHPLITIGIMVLFVIILLFYREDVRDRAIRLLGVQDLERTTRAMDDAGQRLNRYFLAATGINAAFGCVIGIGLWVIGVPNPVLWGAFAMFARFIPFIGVPIAAILPLLLSVVADPGWSMLAWTAALFVLSELFAGQLLETLVHGEATGLSPLAIILATTFWTLLWGPVGLVLAVPVTVMLAVLGRHIDRFAVFEILLGAAPALSPADRFYQRILAGDPEEATDLAESQLGDMALAEYYDDIVMDALKKAVRDREAGRLSVVRVGQIKATLDVFVDEMGEAATVDKALEVAATDAASADDRAQGKQATVLCVGAKSRLDEAAATMLAQLLTARGLTATVATSASISQRLDDNPPSTKADIVCVSAFEAGERSAPVKFLLRRLRRHYPDAEIIGGFWRLDRGNPAHARVINSFSADHVVSSLSAAVERCLVHPSATNSLQHDVAMEKRAEAAVSLSPTHD